MSVLIMGLKMQKEEALKIAIRDGIASVYLDEGKADYYSVIEIPDHGDLIDRDALRNEMRLSESCSRCERDAYRCQYYEEMTVMDVCERIDDAPVVIQAERSEK